MSVEEIILDVFDHSSSREEALSRIAAAVQAATPEEAVEIVGLYSSRLQFHAEQWGIDSLFRDTGFHTLVEESLRALTLLQAKVDSVLGVGKVGEA
ncbi:MAG: hypothetical protein K1X71_11520 [Pirellulales bacterium]|nr:hypothetical protein [Pirellulales bacterium]